ARVSSGVGVAPTPVAPDLVSNFPKFDVEWRWVAVCRAHRAILRTCWSVTVFNPRGSFFDCRAASFNVDSNRRLSTGSTCKRDKFIGAKITGLRFILPRKIGPRWTLIARAYAPHPVIVLGDVSAGPANESRFKLF